MKALVLVDIQNDFMPGGNLPVPDGDQVIPAVNACMQDYPLVVLTQDWHPAGHLSFASSHEGHNPFDTIELDGLQQTLWPDHCIQGSAGADFPPTLDIAPAAAIFRKGMDPSVDSYSAFYDNGKRHKTGLAEWLRAMNADTVHVAGLAAEVCVADTARDAQAEGFNVAILEAATRPLDPTALERVKEKVPVLMG